MGPEGTIEYLLFRANNSAVVLAYILTVRLRHYRKYSIRMHVRKQKQHVFLEDKNFLKKKTHYFKNTKEIKNETTEKYILNITY